MVRFGHCEKGLMLFATGLFMFLVLILMGMPFWYKIIMVFGMFMSTMGIAWIILHVRKYQLTPFLDACMPDETVWLRFTQDRIFIPQYVQKGSYSATKGLLFNEKADVLDDGEYPVKLLNGNPAVIMHDLVNTAISLRRSTARKQMKKKFKIENGIDGYHIAMKKKKVVKDGHSG